MRRLTQFLLIAIFPLFMSGCGSQSSSPPPVQLPLAVVAPVSLTIGDTPPAGVSVLFFQLDITGASLTSQSGQSVSLMSSSNPIPVNVTQLQTDSAFLVTASVPGGDSSTSNGTTSYTSMSVTFSNPQLTIYNGSGAAIGSGANACANNAVCQLTPSTTPLTLTFSSAPFPIAIGAAPVAFKLDIHLNTVIQSDLTVNLADPNGVTVSQLPTPPSGGPVSGLGKLVGTIQTPTTNGFTLQTGDGRTFSIGVDSNTIYDYPSTVCSTDSLSCLATGQIVKVEVSLQSGGNLLASSVTYVQLAGQTVVEGNIIRLSTSGGNTMMDIILQEGPPTPIPNVLPFGHWVTVTVPPTGVTYAIDSPPSFTIPNGLSFASVGDLVVGQEVSVVVQGSVTTASGSGPWGGPAPITFTTNSITLEPSQITGSVKVIDVSTLSFTLSTFPNFFVPLSASPTSLPTFGPFGITEQTTSGTTFTNFTPDSILGLAVNDVVSVEGWLFLSPVQPQFACPSGCAPLTIMAAETVVNRPGPNPQF